MTRVQDIVGIDEVAAERLREVGVRTSEQLIELGASSTARMRLADQTHLDDATIKQWVHQADLMRIPGVSPGLAHLLCQVGVCTVPKLAYRSSEALYAELVSFTSKRHETQYLPTLAELHHYGVSAKHMPKLVHH